jgi:LPXTG-motif cell wall-anchored protein
MNGKRMGNLIVLLVLMFSVVIPFNGGVVQAVTNTSTETNTNIKLIEGVYSPESSTVKLKWEVVQEGEQPTIEPNFTVLKDGTAIEIETKLLDSHKNEMGATVATYQAEDISVEKDHTYTYQVQATLDKVYQTESTVVVIPPDAPVVEIPESTTVKQETATTEPPTEEQTFQQPESSQAKGETVTQKNAEIQQTTETPNINNIAFRDQNLKKLVQNHLRITGEITKEKIKELDYLIIDNIEGEITSLVGLEFATNLEYLSLNDTDVTNLEPIIGLKKLVYLEMSNSNLSNPQELKQISGLQYFLFSGKALTEKTVTVFNELTAKGVSVIAGQEDYASLYATKIMENKLEIDVSLADRGVSNSKLLVNGSLEKSFPASHKTQSYTIKNLQPKTNYTLTLLSYNGDNVVGYFNTFVKTKPIPAGGTVTFEDPNLEQAIKDNLLIEGDIYASDVEEATTLFLSYSDITSLKGLEKANNLKELYVDGNQVTDLSPILSLPNLQTLSLSFNPLKNLSELKNLTKLENLDVSGTTIRSIGFAKGLPNLQTFTATDLLYVENNQETKDTLSYLKSKGVKVNHTIGGSAFLEIEVLQKSDTKALVNWYAYNDEQPDKFIMTVNGTTHEFTGDESEFLLKGLKQSTNYTVTIKAYAGKELVGRATTEFKTESKPTGTKVQFESKALKSLIQETLLLDRTIYESDMQRLTYLDIYDSSIESLKGLEKATNLEMLSLSDLEMTDLSLVKELKSLTELGIYSVPVKDLSFLKELTKLHSVTLHDVVIKDNNVFKNLKNLETLSIWGSNLTEVPNLSGTKLTELDLSENEIANIKGLSRVTTLESLNLAYNKVTSLEDLQALNNLMFLAIDENPIASIKSVHPSVQNLQLGNNSFSMGDLKTAFLNVTSLSIYGSVKHPAKISEVTSLQDIYFTGTTIKDISFLLDLPHLSYLTFDANEYLTFEKGSPEDKVRKKLEEKGVIVEVWTADEVIIEGFESTSDAITFRWTFTGEVEPDSYNIYLDGELMDTVDSATNMYSIEELESDMYYFIGVEAVLDGEPYAYAELEAWTEPKDEGEEAPSPSDPSNGDTVVKLPIQNNTVSIDVKDIENVTGKIITIEAASYNSDKLTFKLTEEAIQLLQKKGIKLKLNGKDVSLTLPSEIFTGSGNVEILLQKHPAVKGGLAPVYDFTITQGGKEIKTFKQPIILTFKVGKVKDADKVSIFYYNPATKKWENIGGVYKGGYVSASTNHFSRYTVLETDAKTVDGSKVQPVDLDDDSTGNPIKKLTGKLPNTGTLTYKLLVLGTGLVVLAGILLFINRRKRTFE